MAYGLQLFNKDGANIMDTNERFTRVYGSYPDNVITGTRNTYADSKYAFMSTFTTTVSVVLPAGIQSWAPLITYATSKWISGNTKSNGVSVDGISYAAYEDYRIAKRNILNIPAAAAYALTGMQVITQDENGTYLPPTAALDYNPKVSAEAVPGPNVKLSYTYLAGINSSSGTPFKSERRATISFVIVGY
jgi:hypothetical protein